MNWSWILKAGFRDFKASPLRILAYVSALNVGIAALTAIHSFKYNIDQSVRKEAKSLLGADVAISNNIPFADSLNIQLANFGNEKSEEWSFASMIYFPKSGDSKLVQIRAVEGNYPFYGEMITTPNNIALPKSGSFSVLADITLKIQYSLQVGDSVRIGNQLFKIDAFVEKISGQTGIAGTVAAPVIIHKADLNNTNLIQTGSRVVYKKLFRFDNESEIDNHIKPIEKQLLNAGYKIETSAERGQSTGNTFNNLNRFLSLIGIAALLLGAIGVVSAGLLYAKEKRNHVALYKCLGVDDQSAFAVYFIQIVWVGTLATIIGILLGIAIQQLLPSFLNSFLPVSVQPQLQWKAIFEAFASGVVLIAITAFYSLFNLLYVNPLQAISRQIDDYKIPALNITWKYLTVIVILFGLLYFLIGSFTFTCLFFLSIALIYFLFFGFARLLQSMAKKLKSDQLSYPIKQALANLYQPDNQTNIIITTTGFGVAVIAFMISLQDVLLKQVEFSNQGNQPNMVFFDIQPNQLDSMELFFKENNLPIIQKVPIVAMRVEAINNLDRFRIKKDTTLGIPGHIVDREYRTTFRDTLIDTETIVEGVFTGFYERADCIPVSVEERTMSQMKAKLGDTLTFNVQGALIKGIIGSVRKVNWNRVQTNFTIVFPKGILEKAPHNFVLITRADSREKSALVQRKSVIQFPNVSIIDLETILQTLDEVLTKVKYAILFMAFFTVFTGFLVFIVSLLLTRYEKFLQVILLKTIGAQTTVIYKIQLAEYFILGFLSASLGLLVAFISVLLVGNFMFEIAAMPYLFNYAIIWIVVVVVTVLIAFFNHKKILAANPMAILSEN
jgi:putative ABC transport system permease protein